MFNIHFAFLLIPIILVPVFCNIAQLHLKFVQNFYTVTEAEFSTADVEIIRNSTSEDPSIVCKLPSNASSDFFSTEAVCVPVDSPPSSPRCCCKFYIQDDDLPEDDESFPVSLITPNVITPVLMNFAFITITYNDDPYGKIGFVESSPSVTTNEPNSANSMTVLSFNITRQGGLFGMQSVFWKIFDSSNQSSIQDIHPSQGYINLTGGVSSQNFSINILPDDIPEDKETYTLQLLSVEGGSMLTSNVNYKITINENDAPIRFKSSQLTCPESHMCTITVLRGIGLDGLRIGPIDHDATVSFRTVNGTASPGIDYVETINNLVFLAGETEKQIEVKILDDSTPENDEYFSIMLVHVTAGVILQDANSASIVISKNDDPHGLISFENPSIMKSYVFREDLMTNYTIPVLRTRGLLGNISVFWNLRAIGPDTTAMVFEQSSGSLHFLDGISTMNVSLDIRNDDVPSEANKYRLSITKVLGGARILPSSNYGDASVEIIVADSDDAYGVVQFSSGEPNLSFFGGVRRIEAKVLRSGGTLADIYVQYEIHYYTDNTLSTPVTGVLVKEKGSISMQKGETEAMIVGFINQNVFLKSGSRFVMMLTNATIGTSLIINPLTPRLGASVSKSITISPHLANGEIGFSNTTTINVEEPSAVERTVHLGLERDGTSERSTVYWVLEAQDSSMKPELDLRPTSGMVILEKGVSRSNITIEILPDDHPELSEVFRIRLTNVTGWNERLRDDATLLTLVINRNDDPGGVFEFASVAPIVMKEEDSSARVRVLRTGGALEKQFVEMLIVNGTEDFNAFKQFQLFQKDEREKTFFIVPKDEERPELNETFLVKMLSYAGSKIGAKSEFHVTILQNDDPHGVISFSQEDVQTVRKLHERNPSKVLFRILRNKGTFGNVVVTWKIRSRDSSNTNKDFLDVSGNVVIEDGQNQGAIGICTISDKIPEQDEYFELHITEVTGGARITTPNVITLIVLENDYPVTLSPLELHIKEGDSATLRLNINKKSFIDTYVSITSSPLSASLTDYVTLNETLIFKPGETSKELNVKTIDDVIPEMNETFLVSVTSASGDYVMFENYTCKVVILSNDNPYGLFQFKSTDDLFVSEGDQLRLGINRLFGTFGEVFVRWQAFNTSGHPITSNELSNLTNTIRFKENETYQEIHVGVTKDGHPELNETITIKLIDVLDNKGNLGDRKERDLIILSSDYPNGVFYINRERSSKYIYEDELKNAHHGNITIAREKGSFYSAKVLWEIHDTKTFGTSSMRVVDLLLHGSSKGPKTGQGRPRSSTPGFEFDKYSCTNFSESMLPATFDVHKGMSVSLWMKNTFSPSPEPLIEKVIEGKLVYSLFLLKREFNLTVVTNTSKYIENMVTIPSEINIHDGQWHNVVITMATNGSISLYVDGSYLKEMTTHYAHLTPIGRITAGCSSSSRTSFIGTLQDVRLHPKTLTPRQVHSLFAPETQLVTFNGELMFGPGETMKSINIKAIDDVIPEPDAEYTFEIIDVKDDVTQRDRAVISSTQEAYQFTVLRSDFAYGKFQLHSDPCLTNMTEDAIPRNITVERVGGTFGTVFVRWEIRHVNGSLASHDFINATGTLMFLPEEVIKNITVVPHDDLLPEEKEEFVFRLTTLTVENDSKLDHTLGNGAMINESRASCKMLIQQNDHMNGLFQLMSFLPSLSMGFIPPLQTQIGISYEEGNKIIPLHVVRAQGTKGGVSVEWQTRGLSAVAGKDFKQRLGKVVLKDGETSAEIQVQLLDNDIPELTKSLQIYLKNPTGGAEIGTGGVLNIHILPSDNALGIFGFKSHDATTNEGATVAVTLQRLGSALAGVHVDWIIRNGSHDFDVPSGKVFFPAQVSEKTFHINVTDDQVAELSETFHVELLNVTGGSIDPLNSTMKITIAPNDHPYGLFNFEQQTLSVREDGQPAMLKVLRSRGLYGHVRLFYTIVMVKGNGTKPADLHDVTTRDGFVDFADHEIAQYVNVTIMDDAIPEIDEMFVVKLSSVRVVGESSGFDTRSMIGEMSTVQVTITKNDNANGVLQFAHDIVRVREDETQALVNVTRTGGLFGDISFSFVVHPKSAIIGEDFKVENFNVQMKENQSVVSLPIFMLQDSLPEFDETFSIELLPNKIFGGATIGVKSKCEVVILENDYPYGRIGFFDTSPVYVNEPESTGSEKVKLRISREGGAFGVVIVQWRSFPMHSSYGSDDIAPLKSNITFLSNEREKMLVIDVEPDATPEINETYTVLLESVTLGKAVLDDTRTSLNVTVLLNDVPFGTVGFLLSSVTTEEKDEESMISLTLVRYGGSYGDLKVFYRTNELKEDASRSASSGSDFETVLNPRYTIIKNGSFTGQINIPIHNDTIPELDEKFQVVLTKVEVVGEEVSDVNRPTLTSQKVVNVTIISNDQPYGMFQLTVDMAKNLSKYVIYEPEGRNLPLTFNIYRKQGLFNLVSVSWRLAPGFSIDRSDVSNVDGNTIFFPPGASRSSFEIIINNDQLPERDESFTIELYNPTNGSVIDPIFGSVHLVISANDNAGGIVSFKQGSLSVIAHEGDNISLTVQRTHSQMGHVLVQWMIVGENAEQDFQHVEGNITLAEGETEANITFQVTVDKDPEPDEIFQVKLASIRTIGLSASGAAVLSRSASVATLSLGASDNPHGVIEFSIGTSPYHVEEKDKQIQLTLVRHFGKLGVVRVMYTIQSNNLKTNVTPAAIMDDIGFNQSSVSIPDGVDSVKLSIPIVDDVIPEIDEGFTVRLVSVQLGDGSNSTSPPKLGISTQVEVVIKANDDANGKLSFALDSLNPILVEKNQIFNLTVIRSLGTFGDVYCFYFLNQLTASAKDFHVKGVMNGGPSKLVFKNGETRATIPVEIFDDELTEDREQFEIGLTVQNAIGNGGVSIGDNNRTVITIDASDGASGVIQFSQLSRDVILREPDDVSNLQSSFNFLVERKKGRYGVVRVMWQVTNTSRSSHDIQPMSGVITFGNLDNQKSFYVSAVKDDIPELNRTVHIELKILSGGAILGLIPVASVTILENDHPYGLFTFVQRPLMITEETGRPYTVTVLRSGGTFGEVSIDYRTVPGTANGDQGNVFHFGVVSFLNASRVHCSHQLNVSGVQYLVVCGADSLLLYQWHGKFLFNKTLLGEKVMQIRSIQTDSLLLLILRSSSSVHLAILQSNLELTLVQTIPAFGVTDVTTFSISQHHYLTYTDAVDRLGETVQDLQLYKWNGRLFEKQTSGIKTFNGMSLDSVDYKNQSYLIVGNHYDRVRNSYFIPSNIYTWTSENRFVLCGDIQTNKVKQLKFQTINHLLVLGEVNLFEQCKVHVLNTTTTCHFHLKQVFLYSCQRMEFFRHGEKDYLFLVTKTVSHMYEWNSLKQTFERKNAFPYKFVNDVSLIQLNNLGVMETFFITKVNASSKSMALRLSLLSEKADFIPSHGRLHFKESQSTCDIHITVLNDTVSEIDERFSIILENPSNGAHISPPSKLDLLVMANGNPHGRFGFSESSLRKVLTENETDVAHMFSVVREFGSFGGVLVYYEVKEHKKMELASDIYPNQGFLNFTTGITSKEIKFFIKSDSTPEVAETFEIKLVRIKAYGTSTNLGASINYNRAVATVVILPNDYPFGIFSFRQHVHVTNVKNEVNFRSVVDIVRSGGTFGDVNVFYATYNAHHVESKERSAVPFKDYIPATGNITMRNGVDHVSVSVSVTHDGNRELNKIFFLNLTSVHLTSHEDYNTHAPPLLAPTRTSLEMVINEVYEENGVVEFLSDNKTVVEESVGQIQIPLVRRNGFVGEVSVYYRVRFDTANQLDILSDRGVVTFAANEVNKMLPIVIVNDEVPELVERFRVELTKPVGGVGLTANNVHQVEIKENDYPYGTFSMKDNHVAVDEGRTAVIRVDRNFGLFGAVQVSWKCEDGLASDAVNISGVIHLKEGQSEQRIHVTTLDDSIPEVDEVFQCALTHVHPGVLTNRSTWKLTIRASDKPHGVLSIAENSRKVFVKEPGRFMLRVDRTVGHQGDVEVSWKVITHKPLKPLDTFKQDTGKIIFKSGVKVQYIDIEVVDDSTPEESELFQLYLLNPTGGAELDTNVTMTVCEVVVAASDHPYGVFVLKEPAQLYHEENVGFITIAVERQFGTISSAAVEYDVIGLNATRGEDFTPSQGVLHFNEGVSHQNISIQIIDDKIPEISETFLVHLSKVTLNKTVDFKQIHGDVIVNTPPMISRVASNLTITILENDFPYGTISFREGEMKVYEWQKVVQIPVIRRDGSVNRQIVSYTYTAGSAVIKQDFDLPVTKQLVFEANQNISHIQLTLNDDVIPEEKETFRLQLTEVKDGGAILGLQNTLNVVIEKSDNPYGLFGLFKASDMTVENPTNDEVIDVVVSRKDGATNRIKVDWKISSERNPSLDVLQDVNPGEGFVIFNDREKNDVTVRFVVRPYGGDQEEEETFIFNLTSASNGASIDENFNSMKITVLKKGHPHGLFKLSDSISPSNSITEPISGSSEVVFQVVRSFGTKGTVKLFWKVESEIGDIQKDVAYSKERSVTFEDGQTVGQIKINVTADDDPELTEKFVVTLLRTEKLGSIDTTRNSESFTVLANDSPYGIFKLPKLEQEIRVNSETLSRVFTITVERSAGHFKEVTATVAIEHRDHDAVEVLVKVLDKRKNGSFAYKIDNALFLSNELPYTLRLKDVKLTSDPDNLNKPRIDTDQSLVRVVVPEHAANSRVEFPRDSFFVSSNTQLMQATFNVTRIGTYGPLKVTWKTGSHTQYDYLTKGTFTPASAQITFLHRVKTKEVTVQVNIPTDTKHSLIYSVLLSDVQPKPNELGWGKIGPNKYSIVDPHGVIQVAFQSRQILTLEGETIDVHFERILSVIGAVRVYYETGVYPRNTSAQANKDFIATQSFIDFAEGEYKKTVKINTINDDSPEKDEDFFVRLTSVKCISKPLDPTSPRLSSQVLSVITIQDNDLPYGIISFAPNSRNVKVLETADYVELDIQRTDGSLSTSRVEVSTIGGSESWEADTIKALNRNPDLVKALQGRENSAQSGFDYNPVKRSLIFSQGFTDGLKVQKQSIRINIIKDDIAEPMEQFIVVLSNPTNGATLFDPHAYAVVSIEGNGLFNGEVGFKPQAPVIDEDGGGAVAVNVTRVGKSVQDIAVSWELVRKDQPALLDEFLEKSGKITIMQGKNGNAIQLRLKDDEKPEYRTWVLVNLTTISAGAIIKRTEAIMNVTLAASDYPAGRIGFDLSSRFPVLHFGDYTTLRVQRYNGSLSKISVKYSTVTTGGRVKHGGVMFSPASEEIDFPRADKTLTFNVGQTQSFIDIRLPTSTTNLDSMSSPKVFNISLSDPSNGAILDPRYKSSLVIITKDVETRRFLNLFSRTLNLPLTEAEVNKILEDLHISLQTSYSQKDLLVVKTTIENVLNFKSSQPAGSRALSNTAKNSLLNVFNTIIKSIPSSAKGYSYWVKVMEKAAYSFLDDQPPVILSYSRDNFDLKVQRKNTSIVGDLVFLSGSDSFVFSANSFPASWEKSYADVHFISFKNAKLFAYDKPVLNNKILSSGMRNNMKKKGSKVTYRINSRSNRITSLDVSCVIWIYSDADATTGYWSDKHCTVKSKSKTWVDCECQHLSEYAVLAKSDDRTGYEIYFFIACFCTLGACFFALVSFHCFAAEKTFTSSLIMQMFFAVMMTNMLFAIDAYLSPNFIYQPDSCSVMAMFLHYFILVQFTTMLAQACNLWRILIMNDEHSERKFIHFTLLAWGLPILIIVAYVFITFAVWGWKYVDMYADLHGIGDLCFIPAPYAALGVAVIPVLLCILVVGVVFVQAYQVTAQWKFYDDICRGRYNIREVRHIISVFILISLTWLFGGLHMVYGYLWMVILFTIFNVTTCLYILIVYVLLRNQMKHLLKGKYQIQQTPEHTDIAIIDKRDEAYKQADMFVDNHPNGIELGEWETAELPRVPSRAISPQSVKSRYTEYNNPRLYHQHGNVNESYDSVELEATDFDDLMYALKTGGRFTPSVNADVIDKEENSMEDVSPPPSPQGGVSIRKLTIGDTHL